jgi:hypothetical protein
MNNIVYMYRRDIAPMWFTQWMPEGYPIEFFDPEKTYSVDTVFYYDMYGGKWEELIEIFLERGHKIIYDAKNEHYVPIAKQWVLDAFKRYPGQGMISISGDRAVDITGVNIQATPYWYWIVDQDNFRRYKLHHFHPQARYDYKFFMTMSLARPDRDYLYEKLQPVLSESLHSYRAHGKYLPEDSNDDSWQRYINPSWLERSCFTLVVETYLQDDRPTGLTLTKDSNWFLCEKTYKPLATQHPFILASTYKNLSYVRQQGFETFPELWDESYDDVPNWTQRIQRIVEIIKEIEINSFDTAIVQEKLKYNQARFFDSELVKQLCDQTVIQPIIEFANG